MGKKSQKSVEKRFLYSHEYREQKIGGKNLRNNFFRNTRIVREKMSGKKSSQKSAKIRFVYNKNIVTQKWGGKNARNNFSRNTRIVRAKNFGNKILSKKCENTFYNIHTNIVTKK